MLGLHYSRFRTRDARKCLNGQDRANGRGQKPRANPRRAASPRTREVFLMHRIEGLRCREIASRLGISQRSVEKHIARAALFLAEWTGGC
jgi:DNA-binding NarL/FixJ family response regulator